MEDKCIPLSFHMLKSFSEVYVRDLPPYEAILMKCTTWMGMFCMMYLAEFTINTEKGVINHAIKTKNIKLIESLGYPGLSVTFESWKGNKWPITLFF